MESKDWKSDSGKRFILKKDQTIFIPKDLEEIRVGLGWDTNCDIDASIILLDIQGNLVDFVYYGKTCTENFSVVHSDDNRKGTGIGVDEEMYIFLDRLDETVDSIWPVITIYSAGTTFSDVTSSFCRVNDNKENELCRINLSNNYDHISNGNIICSIKRYNCNSWALKARGYYTYNTKTYKQIGPVVN